MPTCHRLEGARTPSGRELQTEVGWVGDAQGQPRFVTHIDDGAIGALTKYYEKAFPASGQKDVAILDMCSSWISHFPQGYSAGRITGCGAHPRPKVLARRLLAARWLSALPPYWQ